MSDAKSQIRPELKDFFNEVKCPGCSSLFNVAPVWEFVLRKGYSTCKNCWQVFSLKSDAKLNGFSIASEDLEMVADDYVMGSAGNYVWDATALESSRGAAVDFFISLGLTAFFDGMERSYPELRSEDFEMTWTYLSQAGALAVDPLDARLIADAFEKVERHKPYGWSGDTPRA